MSSVCLAIYTFSLCQAYMSIHGYEEVDGAISCLFGGVYFLQLVS